LALQEEQEAIMRSEEKGDEEKLLTWADTKKMPITSRVIQETLRVASILSFTFREAVEDVEYEGQTPASKKANLTKLQCPFLFARHS
jgi:(+)-abscisic acid 8'-hydroxylase